MSRIILPGKPGRPEPTHGRLDPEAPPPRTCPECGGPLSNNLVAWPYTHFRCSECLWKSHPDCQIGMCDDEQAEWWRETWREARDAVEQKEREG